MVGDIIKAGLHLGGGWLILQDDELQEDTVCKESLHVAGRQMCFQNGNSLRFSIDPNTIGDNGLGRPAPLYRWSCIPQGGELQEDEVCKDSLHTASDGKYVPKWNKLRFSIIPNLVGDNGHLGVITKFGKNLRTRC